MMKFLRHDEQEHLQFGLKWASNEVGAGRTVLLVRSHYFPYRPYNQAGGVMSRAWTTQKPTIAGWYWNRYGKMKVQGIYYVSGDDVYTVGQLGSIPVEKFGGEWSGPIDPPREAREER